MDLKAHTSTHKAKANKPKKNRMEVTIYKWYNLMAKKTIS